MQKILVTGGAGNVGGALVDWLIREPNNFVVTFDNLETGNLQKLPAQIPHQNFKFIKGDVNQYSDISAVMLAYSFDYVFHYAALVGVQRTLANPIKVLQDIQGIKNVLDLAKNTGVKRVFFSSSSEVYGEPVESPQNEATTPLNSRLPYAVVKNVGEAFFRSYQKEYDLDFTIFRFFNTYGPKQSTDFVVPRFVNLALQNKPITIYGDGSQTRTFCYIDDNTEATTNALYQNKFVNDVLNVGNDLETSVLDLARLVIQLTNSKSEIHHLPALEEGDMTRRKPDITKMRQLLNHPLTSLEAGIEKLIKSTTIK